MKKLLALFLATVMLFGVLGINASAVDFGLPSFDRSEAQGRIIPESAARNSVVSILTNAPANALRRGRSHESFRAQLATATPSQRSDIVFRYVGLPYVRFAQHLVDLQSLEAAIFAGVAARQISVAAATALINEMDAAMDGLFDQFFYGGTTVAALSRSDINRLSRAMGNIVRSARRSVAATNVTMPFQFGVTWFADHMWFVLGGIAAVVAVIGVGVAVWYFWG
ncbi:MAG: hypothetical protein FWD06_05505 [Oscillospiraceae bacterium]|nr:hypothetical protein [Oscillospiraceae bacterium]